MSIGHAPATVFVLLAAVPASISAQAPRLEPGVVAGIDSIFARFREPGSPGCAAGVMQNGELVFARGYGLASIELGVPITPATVFDIGSVSKQFTAMAVLLLEQDGKLSLDDEIQHFIPEIPRYQAPVTLRHLLHHTSGLRDYIDVLGWSGFGDESVTTDADALAALVRQRHSNFAAGAEFLYSNSGFFLLSQVVQRVSGESLREFAARRIFGPLGMRHTQFVNRHEMIVTGKAGSYAGDLKHGFALALANWEQTGDGAVNTTIEDLTHWVRNFESGAVGGLQAIRELETTTRLTSGQAIDYALGLSIDTYRGVRQVSHGGSWAGFRAHLAQYPDQRVAVMVLCNLSSSNPALLVHAVADRVLARRFAPEDPARIFTPKPAVNRPVSPEERAAILGRYRSDELFADLVVSSRGDSLFIRPGLGAETWLRPDSAPDTFTAFGTTILFRRRNDRVSGLTLTNRGLRNFELDRSDSAQ